MNNTQFKDKIYNILKVDDRLWDIDKKELNQTLLIDLVEKIDEKIIELLLSDTDLNSKFFIKIKDIFVFKINDFKFFMEENKVYNSYTQYKNRIGLTDGKRFLKDSGDVVLNFPYKDCVLEGGQSTEEGLDSYFEYDEIITKTDEKLGHKANNYNLKQSKRNEIFFNQILAKDEIDRLFDEKAFVNWKRFTTNGSVPVQDINRDVNGVIKENLVIKGNNLLALHSLKSQFKGKIKLIYIDPPYNTGSDSFGYNDRFNHSSWLTFMKNRLEIAKELLQESGLIFVQCDNNEQAYLKVLMDELFQNNYITSITVKSKTPSGVGQESYIFDITETIHVYVKDLKKLIPNKYKIFDEIIDEKSKTSKNYRFMITSFGEKEDEYELTTGSGNKIKVVKLKDFTFISKSQKEATKEWYYNNHKMIFRLSPANGGMMKKITPLLPEGECYIEYIPTKGKYANQLIKIYFIRKEMVVFIDESSEIDNKAKHLNKMVNVHNNWTGESLWQGIANEGNVKLKNGKKPEALLQRIIEICTNENDIVLDYHLGSGTTCAVAHKMNRQYIGIEQLDYDENDSLIRLQNVIDGDTTGISKNINWKGGGEFISFELAKFNEKAKDEIENCNNIVELKKLFDTLYDKYFLNYNFKVKEFRERIINEDNFLLLSLKKQKEIFLTMLDLNQMYIQKSEMDDCRFDISKEEQIFTNKFYNKG
jgi:adenine-specific DNA-methyltransferase